MNAYEEGYQAGVLHDTQLSCHSKHTHTAQRHIMHRVQVRSDLISTSFTGRKTLLN